MNNFCGGFIFFIRDPSPSIAQRHAAFPGMIEFFSRYALFGCLIIFKFSMYRAVYYQQTGLRLSRGGGEFGHIYVLAPFGNAGTPAQYFGVYRFARTHPAAIEPEN